MTLKLIFNSQCAKIVATLRCNVSEENQLTLKPLKWKKSRWKVIFIQRIVISFIILALKMLVGKSCQIYFYGLISPICQKELYGLPFHRQTLDSEVCILFSCQMSFRRPAPGAICEFIVWFEAHSASYCVHSCIKKNKRSVLILVKAQNIRIWCRYTEFCHF